MHAGELFPTPSAGTFTPQVVGATTPGVATYGAGGQQGRYMKIGDMVFVVIVLQWTAHTGTGFAQITGLPFVAGGASAMRYSLLGTPGLNLTYAGDGVFGNIGTGTALVELRNYTSGLINSRLTLGAAGTIQLQGMYLVN